MTIESHSSVDWAKRQEHLREAEWQTSLKLLDHAASILDNPRVRCTFLDALRALELASILGRRATGLPLMPEQEKPQKLLPWQQVSDEDLIRRVKQVYGSAFRSTDLTRPVPNPRPPPSFPLPTQLPPAKILAQTAKTQFLNTIRRPVVTMETQLTIRKHT